MLSRIAFIILVRLLVVGPPVAIVTKGIIFVQHNRQALSPLKDYMTDLVISEEVDF